MRILDVTVPLSAEVPAFPGDPPFELRTLSRVEDGAAYSLSRLCLGTHSGTHVDAPAHFLAGGAGVEQLPLEILMGKARVVELPVSERIERHDLQELDLSDDLRVLLKTRMSGQLRQPVFHQDHVYLTADAAVYLAQIGIKLVGIDYLSLEQFGSSDYAAHRALLAAGVVIVEGLDLSEVEPGEYDMTCLPLRIPGADGSPARVVLRTRG